MSAYAIPYGGHTCVANRQHLGASSKITAEPPMWRATFDEENTLRVDPVRIPASSGNLRRHAYNTALLHVLNRPKVFVTNADTKFDAQLQLIDEPTRYIITRLLADLVAWTRQLQQGRPWMEALV